MKQIEAAMRTFVVVVTDDNAESIDRLNFQNIAGVGYQLIRKATITAVDYLHFCLDCAAYSHQVHLLYSRINC